MIPTRYRVAAFLFGLLFFAAPNLAEATYLFSNGGEYCDRQSLRLIVPQSLLVLVD